MFVHQTNCVSKTIQSVNFDKVIRKKGGQIFWDIVYITVSKTIKPNMTMYLNSSSTSVTTPTCVPLICPFQTYFVINGYTVAQHYH